MKVLGEYVLLEQITTPKKSSIILPSQLKEDKNNVDIVCRIKSFGKKAKEIAEQMEIKENDIPILAQHTQFQGMKITEKTEKKMITLTIVHIDEIIGIDDELEKEPEIPVSGPKGIA